jgi:hypothetical protein
LGVVSEEEAVQFPEMTDRRNDTSHTYKEEVGQIIYDKRQKYFLLTESLLKKFGGKII